MSVWVGGSVADVKQPQAVFPFNIQPVVVVRGLKRQQVAALTNFVGCFFFLLCLTSFFSPSALNDLAGPSVGPLVQKTYSYSYSQAVLPTKPSL